MTKQFLFTLTRASVMAMFAGLTVTSCTTSKNAGLSLGVSLSPTKAFIVPGKGVSCVAQAAAKEAGGTPEADVSGDRVLFNRFAMQWRSNDKLTIASITATIFSSGISGADTIEGLEVSVDENEMAALLGLTGLSIPYASPYNTGDVTRTISIDSTDATAKTSGPYAPCGFQIGGLASVEGVKTYSARIKIEVSGYKTKCLLQEDGSCLDDEQTPVRQTVTVTAERY